MISGMKGWFLAALISAGPFWGGASEAAEPERRILEALPAGEEASWEGDSHRWGEVGWTGAGIAAAGSVFLLGASTLGMMASRGIGELPAISSREVYDERLATIERQQRVGRGLLWGGTGLVAVGAGLALFDVSSWGDSRGRSARLLPGEDGVWVVWGGAF